MWNFIVLNRDLISIVLSNIGSFILLATLWDIKRLGVMDE